LPLLPGLAMTGPLAGASVLPLSVARSVPLAVSGTLVRAWSLSGTAKSLLADRSMLAARLAGPMTASSATAMPIAVHLALMRGELGYLPFGNLSFRARECCTDKRPMYRPFIFNCGLLVADVFSWKRVRVRRRCDGGRCLNGSWGLRGGDWLAWFDQRSWLGDVCGGLGLYSSALSRHAGRNVGMQRRGRILLPALRRHFSLFVLVLGVAGGAASLLHLVLNHCDDGMIGNPSFARTIVVHDVTEPKPALLHELPRSCVPFRGGMSESTNAGC
jgi:hypothetical protein